MRNTPSSANGHDGPGEEPSHGEPESKGKAEAGVLKKYSYRSLERFIS